LPRTKTGISLAAEQFVARAHLVASPTDTSPRDLTGGTAKAAALT